MKSSTQRRLRDLHNWFGVFFAPGILFFSLTGVIQTLGLHEAHDGGRVPTWIATIANLHKHQVTSHGPRRAPAPRAAAATAAAPRHGAGHDDHDHDHDAPLSALKLYVVGLAAVLFASTLAGVTIALTNRAVRRRTWGLLAAGTLVPVVLLLI